MPRDTDDGSTPTPHAPGWYPDPWSADGRGERYFDGKKWGTSERPLARHSDGGNVIQIGRRKRRRIRIRRPSRTVVLVTALVVAVLGLTLVRNRHSSSAPKLADLPSQVLDRPPPARDEAPKPLGGPPAAPLAGGGYEISEHQPDDAAAPVAWDPCRPIHYVVNPVGAPPDGAALIASAIERLHAVTGFVFINDGTTTELPDKERHAYIPARYADRWAPVLIAWSNETAFPELAGYVAGVGSAHPVYTADAQHLVYVSGALVLDSNQMSARAIPRRAEARAIILHELGHVMGLDHTSDRTQVMFSESQFNVLDYRAGDLRGLALLATQPCYPDV